jgi:hypothetical protein
MLSTTNYTNIHEWREGGGDSECGVRNAECGMGLGKWGMGSAECGRWTPVLDDPGGVAEISWGLRGRQHPTPPDAEWGMGEVLKFWSGNTGKV